MVLKKNNLITVLTDIGREFNISFDLLVSTFTQHKQEWRSVIHFTIDGKGGKYGQRTPGIFFFNWRLEIYSAVNGNPNYAYKHGTKLEVKKWMNLEISQTLIDYKEGRQVKSKTLFFIEIVKTG